MNGNIYGLLWVLCAISLLSSCTSPGQPDGSTPAPETAQASTERPSPPRPPSELRLPPDAQRTEPGFFSKVLKPGNGEVHSTPSNRVVVQVEIWAPDGRLVSSTALRGGPLSFPLGRTDPKMIAGIKLMAVGEKRRFWFPQPGPNAGPQVLDVELLDIQDLNQETTLTKAQAEVVEQFNQIYANSHIEARNITWLGVEIQQNPCDCWIMQEIILQLKPDYIIETGTYTGGSALYFASLLELAGIDGKVITIDINPQVEAASRHKLFQKRVEVIQSDSTAAELIEKLAARVTGKKVLVTLDSLHTKDHVLKELNLYAPLVSVNGYLVVQDTRIRDFFPTAGPGPGEAVAEFLKTRDNFVVDRSREQLLLTYYPGGYLKRIK